MKAVFHGTILAESDNTIQLEGNTYFPSGSLNKEYIENSETKTTCPHKWVASYYNIHVQGKTHTDTGRYYSDPKTWYEHIAGHVAFYPVVSVEE